MKKMFLFQVVFLTATLNAIEPDNYLSLKDYVEPVQIVEEESVSVISTGSVRNIDDNKSTPISVENNIYHEKSDTKKEEIVYVPSKGAIMLTEIKDKLMGKLKQ